MRNSLHFFAKRLHKSALALCAAMTCLSAQAQLDYSGFKQVFPDATDGSEYLYEATYKDYDYDAAMKVFNLLATDWNKSTLSSISASDLATLLKLSFQAAPDERTACAEIRKGKFMGRNLDGDYNNFCNIVMRVDSAEGRLASVGVGRIEVLGSKMAFDKNLLPGFIMNCAPMFTNDGINSAGVCIAVNSLPRINLTPTMSTNPGMPRICEAVLPRVILDKAHSVDEALDIINNSDIFVPHNDALGVYRELHFIIADAHSTAVVEFYNNKVYVQRTDDVNNTDTTQVADANIMTNFWQTQLDNDSLSRAGVERYKILQQHFYDVPSEEATADDIYDMMSRVWISKVFYEHQKPYWITDLLWKVPWYDLKPGSTTEAGRKTEHDTNLMIDMISDVCQPELLKKYRPSLVEATLHTAIYNTEDKSMMLVPAQTGKKLYYKVESNNE